MNVLSNAQPSIEQFQIPNRLIASILCKLIPAACPFERDIVLLGHKVAHVPPLCKLNPFYDQLTALRFKALEYLAH